MTNHTRKIANKAPVKQISDALTAARARYEIECEMVHATHWELYDGDCLLTPLDRTTSSFTVEWGKLVFSFWGADFSECWRVVDCHVEDGQIRFRATRGFGREMKAFRLRDPDRLTITQRAGRDERRVSFRHQLAHIIRSTFTGIRGIDTRHLSNVSQIAPAQYARLIFEWLGERILALGVDSHAPSPEIDSILTFGLSSILKAETRFSRLWLFLPRGHARTTLERLTFMHTQRLDWKIECFEFDQEEAFAVRPFSQPELIGNSSSDLIWPDPEATSGSWRERIVSLAPDQIEVRTRIAGIGEAYAINGLEFAVARYGKTHRTYFGVPVLPDQPIASIGGKSREERRELTRRNFGELENLVNGIVRHRREAAEDRRHPFFRLRPEAWLESLLRRNIRALDVNLNPDFVYSQIPTWIGGDRSVLDLLTVNSEGRLVVIEIKAAEDPQLPVQGLDYWIRVEQARQRGDFHQRRLFDGVPLDPRPSLLYLVAPGLRFHRTFGRIAGMISPEIEVYRIGVNGNWRAGIKVRRHERLNPS